MNQSENKGKRVASRLSLSWELAGVLLCGFAFLHTYTTSLQKESSRPRPPPPRPPLPPAHNHITSFVPSPSRSMSVSRVRVTVGLHETRVSTLHALPADSPPPAQRRSADTRTAPLPQWPTQTQTQRHWAPTGPYTYRRERPARGRGAQERAPGDRQARESMGGPVQWSAAAQIAARHSPSQGGGAVRTQPACPDALTQSPQPHTPQHPQ